MMQTPEDGDRYDVADRLAVSEKRGVLVER